MERREKGPIIISILQQLQQEKKQMKIYFANLEKVPNQTSISQNSADKNKGWKTDNVGPKEHVMSELGFSMNLSRNVFFRASLVNASWFRLTLSLKKKKKERE